MPTLGPIETEAAAVRLHAELLQQVHDLVRQSPASVQRWITFAHAMLAAHGTPIGRRRSWWWSVAIRLCSNWH